MTAQHVLDQARAAAMHGNRFRIDAERHGRFLTVVEGPLTAPAISWATMPGAEMSTCPHLPKNAPPQPLFGDLFRLGELLCAHCAISDSRTMPATCAGCGAGIDADDLDRRVVVIGLDNFISLFGYACPACRALCDPKPTTEGEQTA